MLAAVEAPAPTAGRAIATVTKVPVTTRDGKRVPLGSRIQPGKPTLISFWASWCAPCLAEAPWLNRLRRQYAGRYNFLYVNRREGEPDTFQPPAAMAQFLTRAGMADVDYVSVDVAGYERIVGRDMAQIPEGKVGIPRVYLFDARGKQVWTAYGFSDEEGPQLEQRLRGAMQR